MNAIKNFAEAKSALKTLRELASSVESFVVSMEDRIDAVAALKGDNNQPDLPLHLNANDFKKAPESWNDRVMEVFRIANRPLTQKEAVNLYESLNWPKNFAHSLYQTMSGSIAYLHRKKGVLERTDQGYKIRAGIQ